MPMFRQLSGMIALHLGSIAAMISVYLYYATRQQLRQVYAHQLLHILSSKDLQSHRAWRSVAGAHLLTFHTD